MQYYLRDRALEAKGSWPAEHDGTPRRQKIKKQRYVYYHCIGYVDKCQGNPATCRRGYVREEVLEAKFTELVGGEIHRAPRLGEEAIVR